MPREYSSWKFSSNAAAALTTPRFRVPVFIRCKRYSGKRVFGIRNDRGTRGAKWSLLHGRCWR